MRLTVMVAALATGAVLVGCSSPATDTANPSSSATGTTASTSAVPTSPSSVPTSPSGTATASPASSPTVRIASTSRVVRTATSSDVALLTAVRVAGHDGYDRVVLQFDGPVPGFDIRYVAKPVRADPSDRVVAVRGGAALKATLRPASGVDLTSPTAARSYTGPARVTGSTSAVTVVVQTGDFENVLTWVIGVDEKRPFRVLTMHDPTRVVIDVSTS